MKIKEGMFAVKLYELEQQYGRMQSRLHLCQQDDHQKIRRELQRATEEYQEDELLLKKNVENSRSPAVAALAEAQLEYSRRVKEIYDRELPEYFQEATDGKERLWFPVCAQPDWRIRRTGRLRSFPADSFSGYFSPERWRRSRP